MMSKLPTVEEGVQQTQTPIQSQLQNQSQPPAQTQQSPQSAQPVGSNSLERYRQERSSNVEFQQPSNSAQQVLDFSCAPTQNLANGPTSTSMMHATSTPGNPVNPHFPVTSSILGQSILRPSQSSRPSGTQTFQCHHQDCLRIFSRKTSLTNHLKAHQNIRSRSIYRTKRARQRAEEQRRAAETAAAVAKMAAEEDARLAKSPLFTQGKNGRVRYTYQTLSSNFHRTSESGTSTSIPLSTLPSTMLASSTHLLTSSVIPCNPSSGDIVAQSTQLLDTSCDKTLNSARNEGVRRNDTSPVSTNEATHMNTTIQSNNPEETYEDKTNNENCYPDGQSVAQSAFGTQSMTTLKAADVCDTTVYPIAPPGQDLSLFEQYNSPFMNSNDYSLKGTSFSFPSITMTDQSKRIANSGWEEQECPNVQGVSVENLADSENPLPDSCDAILPTEEILEEMNIFSTFGYNGDLSFP